MRVGYGYDVHRLAPGRDLWLGGVRVEFERGLVGHSDADVLVHAVADALLGAAGQGDIGQHFPEHDGRWKDLKGSALMERVLNQVKEKKFRPVNVDCIVHAERPKLSPYRDAIRESLARMLGLPVGAVNVKFKTNEGLDAVGQNLAIAASAVALLSD